MPLPPYIKEKLEDKNRYQTVYAKIEGSAAAPTAGLHFTNEINQKIMSQNKTKKKLQKQKLNCGYEAEDNFKLMQEKIEDYLRSLSNAMETIEKANM